MNADAWTNVFVPIVIPIIVAIITAAGTLAITRWADTRAKLRERYAAAVGTLVAWIEFPYRVRRRTDDTAPTLAALVDRGHDLQEKMARDRAWIATEDEQVAAVYLTTKSSIAAAVGPAINEAWNSPPAATAAAMNLGEWGPAAACQSTIHLLETAIAKRFNNT